MTVFRTHITFHWSLLIPFLICFADSQRVLLLAALFGIVTLHEYGHIFMCRAFGNDCKKIILCAMGGMAILERGSKRPMEEFLVAVSGPLVNVLIMVLLIPLSHVPALQPIILVNAVMLFFNLIPAFPMDGGRVLRSALWAILGIKWANRICLGITLILATTGTILSIQHGHYWMAFVSVVVGLLGALSCRESDEQERTDCEMDSGPGSGRAASEQDRELLRPDARALGYDRYVRREIQEGIQTKSDGRDGEKAEGTQGS